MKRVKILLTLLVLAFTFGVASAQSDTTNHVNTPSPPFNEEMAVNDVCLGFEPERLRSLLPTCSATISNGYLTLYVSTYIGYVTATLENLVTGETQTVEFDTMFKCEVTFPNQLPLSEYKLIITGSNGYLGEGCI